MTAISAAKHPARSKDRCVEMLEDLWGGPLQLLLRNRSGTWELSSEVDSAMASPAELDDLQVAALLDAACREQQAKIRELPTGDLLLALPLTDSRRENDQVVVAVAGEDSVASLTRFAAAAQLCLQQQQELTRLTEENQLFVKQVSDDFEELTFLRSLAERLSLEEDLGTAATLTQFALPLLVQAACVEGLYYFDSPSKQALRMVERWDASGAEDLAVSDRQL